MLRRSTSNDGKNQSGFALILILCLVAFLMLLTLALATFTRVETQVASNSQKKALARQNALFALNVALGQIQTATGPDQRITARAEILDTTPADAKVDGVRQPYWTGVWRTGPAPLDPRIDKPTEKSQRELSFGKPNPDLVDKIQKAEWLVSNPNPALKFDPSSWVGELKGDNPTAVIMAKDVGVEKNTVSVPLVEIKSELSGFQEARVIGKYAYWVSDEGIKAKANLTDPTLEKNQKNASESFPLSLLHFSIPQANAPHKAFASIAEDLKLYSSGSESIDPLLGDLRERADIGKVLNPATFSMLTTEGSTQSSKLKVSDYSPDITTYSYGVIADVRNGGLKQDLTAALEDEDPAMPQFRKLKGNDEAGNWSVYRASDAASVSTGNFTDNAKSMDGLFWKSLYYYYNLYKSSMPNLDPMTKTTSYAFKPLKGVRSSASWPLKANNLPFTIDARYYADKKLGVWPAPLYGDRICPVVLAFGYDIALASKPVGSVYQLELRCYPRLILYNPYSVRLNYADAYNPKFTMKFPFYKQMARIVVGSGGSTKSVDISIDSAPTIEAAGIKQNTIMEPGEIRYFGLPSNSNSTNQNLAGIAYSLSSDSMTSPDNYVSIDIREPSGNIIEYTNENDLVYVYLLNSKTGQPAANPPSLFETELWNAPRFDWVKVGANTGRIAWFSPPNYATTPHKNWPVNGRPINELSGNPYRVATAYLRSKGLLPSSQSNKFYNGSNGIPIGLGSSPDFNIIDPSSVTMEYMIADMGEPYDSDAISTEYDKTRNVMGSSWGNTSAGEEAGTKTIILRDIPTMPMASIGQFMHLPTYNTYSTGSINRSVTFPSTFVGGSIACPNIDPNYTADTSNPGSNRLMIDHSFRANESLFDSYFFSTVPSIINSNPASSVYPTPYNNFKAESIENSKPLPNNRMKYYRKEGKSPDIDDLRDVNKVAANLILDGAFNVNSTSVNAWISLLSSLSGNSLAIYNSFTRQITSLDPDTLKNPIPRFLNASASGNVNQAWDGTRALTDEEVKKLAQKIVEQVKLRGPFLSMGDFFNRRLGSSASPYTLNGALQAAIDQTNINASIENMGSDISFPSDIEDNPKLDINRFPPRTSKTTAGIPGYLMQQDLVQSFSPVMTVRSDTFIVRAYGEATNLSSTDKAWLEAVVQRTPEYIDSAIDKFPELKPAPNSINGVFGRRYKIVSFRWLNENEL